MKAGHVDGLWSRTCFMHLITCVLFLSFLFCFFSFGFFFWTIILNSASACSLVFVRLPGFAQPCSYLFVSKDLSFYYFTTCVVLLGPEQNSDNGCLTEIREMRDDVALYGLRAQMILIMYLKQCKTTFIQLYQAVKMVRIIFSDQITRESHKSWPFDSFSPRLSYAVRRGTWGDTMISV